MEADKTEEGIMSPESKVASRPEPYVWHPEWDKPQTFTVLPVQQATPYQHVDNHIVIPTTAGSSPKATEVFPTSSYSRVVLTIP